MFDFFQKVSDEYGDRDQDAVGDYISGLMDQFFESPEAKPIIEAEGDVQWAAFMMNYGFNYLGSSPEEMTPRDFDEIVFELFPQKVSVEADKAGAIIDELRAFWNFVARQYGAKNAGPNLNILNGNSTERLRKELANPHNYGMAKSFFMAGKHAGYDMTDQKQMMAFQGEYNRLLSTAPRGDLMMIEQPLKSADAIKQKRKERKRQRDAKKRNRKSR